MTPRVRGWLQFSCAQSEPIRHELAGIEPGACRIDSAVAVVQGIALFHSPGDRCYHVCVQTSPTWARTNVRSAHVGTFAENPISRVGKAPTRGPDAPKSCVPPARLMRQSQSLVCRQHT